MNVFDLMLCMLLIYTLFSAFFSHYFQETVETTNHSVHKVMIWLIIILRVVNVMCIRFYVFNFGAAKSDIVSNLTFYLSVLDKETQ